jgi:hypothetical protein
MLKAPIAATLLACTACAGGYAVVESGPPPYPPDDGYRWRHPRDRVVLVYEADVSVYVVSGYRNCYYYGGQYYRLNGDSWYITSHIDGPWTTVSYKAIPSGLHRKYKDNPGQANKHHGHGHGHGEG